MEGMLPLILYFNSLIFSFFREGLNICLFFLNNIFFIFRHRYICPREFNSVGRDKCIIHARSVVQTPATKKKRHRYIHMINFDICTI